MVLYSCAVADCPNRQSIKVNCQSIQQEIIYYRFPVKNKAICKQWITQCHRTGKGNPEYLRVCSDHFSADDFERDLKSELLGLQRRKKLKPDAVPRLHPNRPGCAGIEESITERQQRQVIKERKLIVDELLKARELEDLAKQDEEEDNINADSDIRNPFNEGLPVFAPVNLGCIICGDLNYLSIRSSESDKRLMKAWRGDWAKSLCKMLGIGSNYEDVFLEGKFCSRCLEIVCTGESTIKFLLHLQNQLAEVENTVQQLFRTNHSIKTETGEEFEEDMESIMNRVKFELTGIWTTSVVPPLEGIEENGLFVEKLPTTKKLKQLKHRQIQNTSPRRPRMDILQPQQKATPHSLLDNSRPVICNIPNCRANNTTFPTTDKLQAHLIQTHGFSEVESLPFYQCDKCELRFEHRSELDAHKRLAMFDPRHEPDDPEDLFWSSITQGLPVQKQSKKIKIPEDAKDNNKPMLQSRSNLCSKCGVFFELYSTLKNHLRMVHGSTELKKCEVCGKSFRGSTFQQSAAIRVHERLHSDVNPFGCVFCDKELRSTVELKQHVKDVHEEFPWKCNVDNCEKAFELEHKLKEHKKKHSVQTQLHKCKECEYTATSNAKVRIHWIVKHSTEKQFRCTVDGCQKAFKFNRKLSLHMQLVHRIGITKFHQCRICGKEFVKSYSLTKHEHTHSSERPFVCQVCPAAFKWKKNLRQHYQVHDAEKKHRKYRINYGSQE